MKMRKMITGVVLLHLLFSPMGNRLFAQDKVVDSAVLDRLAELEKQVNYNKPGQDHFMVAGLTTIGWNLNKTTVKSGGISQSVKTNSFPDDADFEFSFGGLEVDRLDQIPRLIDRDDPGL